MKLITFTGVMGSGKSTAVSALEEFRPHRTLFKNVKFAEPLYQMQEFIYNTVEPAYKRPKEFIKDRKLLQWLGTEFGRNSIRDSIWVDLWKSKVLECKSDSLLLRDYYVTCDDVRFDNEAQAVHDLEGYVIKIINNRSHTLIDTTTGIRNHASENGISDKYVDFQIHNDYSIEEFKTGLKNIFEIISKSKQKENKNGI